MNTRAKLMCQQPTELPGPLLLLDLRLFLEACQVQEHAGEEARQVKAEFLAGDELTLEQAP
jgi:hypothetical protein